MPEILAPIPSYNSTRLIGAELELDSVGTEFRAPTLPNSWATHYDGSLRNGREFVLEPALPYNSLLPAVQAFSTAVERARTNMGKRGGFHVHVQSQEFNQARPAWLLARTYTHFQRVISEMLAPSRANNSFCKPYVASTLNDPNFISQKFNLTSPARSRSDAKGGADRYWTMNFGMCRCATPAHRSVEFRQGSPSGMVVNIYGWITFVLALTEMVVRQPAMAEACIRDYPQHRVVDLADLLDRYAETVGASNLGAWVKWRHDYMMAEPTDAQVDAAVALIQRPHGIFHIGEQMHVHNNLALKILNKAVADGKAIKVSSTHYRSAYETLNVATDDLGELEQIFSTVRRDGPATVLLSTLFPPPVVVEPRPAAPAPDDSPAPQETGPAFGQVTSAEPDQETVESVEETVASESPVGHILTTMDGSLIPLNANRRPPRRLPTSTAGTPRRRGGRATPDVPTVTDRENGRWTILGQPYRMLTPAVLSSLPAGHTVYGLAGERLTTPLAGNAIVGLPEDEFNLLTSEGEPVGGYNGGDDIHDIRDEEEI